MSSTNFSVSINPESTDLLFHQSGAISVTINNGMNYAHLHFATPYEAWKWADNLAKSLAKSITEEQIKLTSEVQNG
jgi:hypothetical protein